MKGHTKREGKTRESCRCCVRSIDLVCEKTGNQHQDGFISVYLKGVTSTSNFSFNFRSNLKQETMDLLIRILPVVILCLCTFLCIECNNTTGQTGGQSGTNTVTDDSIGEKTALEKGIEGLFKMTNNFLDLLVKDNFFDKSTGAFSKY